MPSSTIWNIPKNCDLIKTNNLSYHTISLKPNNVERDVIQTYKEYIPECSEVETIPYMNHITSKIYSYISFPDIVKKIIFYITYKIRSYIKLFNTHNYSENIQNQIKCRINNKQEILKMLNNRKIIIDNTCKNINNEICSICLDNMKPSNISITICGHFYCFTCITLVLLHNNKCPQCRNIISSQNIFRVGFTKEIKNKYLQHYGTKIHYLSRLINQYYTKKAIIIVSESENILNLINNICIEKKYNLIQDIKDINNSSVLLLNSKNSDYFFKYNEFINNIIFVLDKDFKIEDKKYVNNIFLLQYL